MSRRKNPPTVRVPDRLPAALMARVEAWRQAQAKPPSKVEALRHLIDSGLRRSPKSPRIDPDE